MLEIKTIVAATDFSPLGDIAVECAASVARRFQAATLEIVHVLKPATGAEGQDSAKTEEARARERLAAMEIDSGDARVTKQLQSGDPARQIASAADEVHADLIVLGSHGRPTLMRALHGSVTSELIRIGRSDVLVVGKNRPRLDAKRILAAVDLSPISEAVIDRALAISRAFGASVEVVSVFEERGYGATERDRERHRGEVIRFLEQVGAPELIPHLAVPKGASGAKELLAYAENEATDLIIVGTSARGALERLLSGSTAGKVLAEAPCPAWVVPSRDA